MEKAAQETLFGEFTKPSYETWKAAASETLKDIPFEKKLCTPTLEGLTLQPIYNAADVKAAADGFPGQGTLLRGATSAGYLPEGWQIAQELPYGDPAEWNRAVMEDLGRGQSALNIFLDIATQRGQDPDEAKPGEVGACGLSLATVGDCEKAFRGIVFKAVSVYWQLGVAGVPTLALFAAHLRKAKVALEDMRGSFDMDPLSVALRAGQLPMGLERAYDELAAAFFWAKKEMPQMGILGVAGQTYADAGSSAAQELAYTLSATVEYLKAMTARGLKPEEVLSRTRWIFSVGPQFFMEVAKFRAARLLWSQLLSAYGLSADEIPPRFHARTGLYHKTVYDPHVNVLRASMEAFAAVTGGIESLHVGPFDEVLREPDSLSRRIARNAQVILREECALDKIIDPAGGSYYVETLTAQLGEKAWGIFQGVEKLGGFLANIENGALQKAVAETAGQRAKRLGQRRDVLVGTNLYAVAKETPQRGISADYAALHAARSQSIVKERNATSHAQDVAVLEKLQGLLLEGNTPSHTLVDLAVKAADAGATLGEISRTLRAGSSPSGAISRLSYTRLSQPYEELRARAHVAHPKVFLCTMGPLRQHKLRADFIQSFVEAGGIEVIYPKGFETTADAAKAAAESGAKVAVICSTDETYPTVVPELAKALKAAAPGVRIYLAGQPAAEHEASYRAAGMDDFIFVKSNHLETLQKIVELYKA